MYNAFLSLLHNSCDGCTCQVWNRLLSRNSRTSQYGGGHLVSLFFLAAHAPIHLQLPRLSEHNTTELQATYNKVIWQAKATSRRLTTCLTLQWLLRPVLEPRRVLEDWQRGGGRINTHFCRACRASRLRAITPERTFVSQRLDGDI